MKNKFKNNFENIKNIFENISDQVAMNNYSKMT